MPGDVRFPQEDTLTTKRSKGSMRMRKLVGDVVAVMAGEAL
jgi:hypothetical protein